MNRIKLNDLIAVRPLSRRESVAVSGGEHFGGQPHWGSRRCHVVYAPGFPPRRWFVCTGPRRRG
jgi:hypothetical protein